ncbi:MAG TPA: hypothetical protein VE825_06535 [Terriglobales bacterium]|jgi:hypothetical protein|nr:hypothetical protein [Terriglobales bacterium]
MATLPNRHHEVWPRERAGYEDRRTVAYAAGDAARLHVFLNWTAWEARLGGLIVALAVIWGVRLLTSDAGSLHALWLTTGPREAAALGLLAWLHAKWQRSITLR